MDAKTENEPQMDQPSLKLWRAGCRFTQIRQEIGIAAKEHKERKEKGTRMDANKDREWTRRQRLQMDHPVPAIIDKPLHGAIFVPERCSVVGYS